MSDGIPENDNFVVVVCLSADETSLTNLRNNLSNFGAVVGNRAHGLQSPQVFERAKRHYPAVCARGTWRGYRNQRSVFLLRKNKNGKYQNEIQDHNYEEESHCSNLLCTFLKVAEMTKEQQCFLFIAAVVVSIFNQGG